MPKLAIIEHNERNKDVISIFQSLGGNSKKTKVTKVIGNKPYWVYYIDDDGNVVYNYPKYVKKTHKLFSLEEFEEKYPYKIGDKVIINNCNTPCSILSMNWNGNEIEYTLSNSNKNKVFLTNEITFFENNKETKITEPFENDTIIKITIPNGYEFVGIDDDEKQIILEKIKPVYPKTYKECCDILGVDMIKNVIGGYKTNVLARLQELIIVRDAYFKFVNDNEIVIEKNDLDEQYYIYYDGETIVKENGTPFRNTILIFPSEEVRDIFYENFKDLIEECKEFL
jgi:hypothetical protein